MGSARNSYTDNKFDNTGSAAASLQQPWSTFSGNTIRAANILDAGAAISVAAGTSHVSVEHNKCAANVFVRLRPSRATAPLSLWWLAVPQSRSPMASDPISACLRCYQTNISRSSLDPQAIAVAGQGVVGPQHGGRQDRGW